MKTGHHGEAELCTGQVLSATQLLLTYFSELILSTLDLCQSLLFLLNHNLPLCRHVG